MLRLILFCRYVTSYTNPGPVIRLTEKSRSHAVQLDKVSGKSAKK